MKLFRLMPGVLLLVVLVTTCACGGGKKAPATPATAPEGTSAAESPSAAATTTALSGETIGGATVLPTKLAGVDGLPRGRVFYIEGGCYACDGSPTSLDRVYVDAKGQFHSDRVFEARGSDGPGPSISGIAVSTDGHEIVVAVCSLNSCGEAMNLRAGATITLKHSVDGGVTWSDFGTWAGAGGVMAVEAGKAFVVRIRADAPSSLEYVSYPDNRVYASYGVPSDRIVAHVGNSFVVTANDEHTVFEQILGGTFVVPSLPADSHIFRLQALAGAPTLFSWFSGPDSARVTYVGVQGDQPNAFSRVVKLATPVAYYDLGEGALTPDGKTLFGSALVPPTTGGGARPTIVSVDMTTGVVTPLAQPELATRSLGGDRLLLRGTAVGPFVRVESGSDCLNVRGGSSVETTSLGCYRDSVLLVDRGVTAVSAGTTWVGVRTPGGRDGWVSSEFIAAPGRDMAATPLRTTPNTGDAAIDAIIAALATGDAAKLLPLVGFEKVPCVTHQDGIGAPELCPAGVAEGTPLDVLPGSQCEGYFTPRETVAGGSLSYAAAWSVYAVVRLHSVATEPYWPSGDTSILFIQAGQFPQFVHSVYVASGEIVRTAGGCGATPDDALRGVAPVDILYRAP